MNHVIEHQPMDVRDVASILDNLADSTTEPPNFRKIYQKNYARLGLYKVTYFAIFSTTHFTSDPEVRALSAG